MGANDHSSRKKTKVSFHLTLLHFLCISSSHAAEISILVDRLLCYQTVGWMKMPFGTEVGPVTLV